MKSLVFLMFFNAKGYPFESAASKRGRSKIIRAKNRSELCGIHEKEETASHVVWRT